MSLSSSAMAEAALGDACAPAKSATPAPKKRRAISRADQIQAPEAR